MKIDNRRFRGVDFSKTDEVMKTSRVRVRLIFYGPGFADSVGQTAAVMILKSRRFEFPNARCSFGIWNRRDFRELVIETVKDCARLFRGPCFAMTILTEVIRVWTAIDRGSRAYADPCQHLLQWRTLDWQRYVLHSSRSYENYICDCFNFCAIVCIYSRCVSDVLFRYPRHAPRRQKYGAPKACRLPRETDGVNEPL